ncbi:hypothetical protein FRC03_005572 [Tulasnella sp. 419]|nr:hypothetical protein FRC02_012358 [Tulasnella sp. 418]KAG8940361.1 hypothetical protein FRC03_005572 [Tulasnella sp. 419]
MSLAIRPRHRTTPELRPIRKSSSFVHWAPQSHAIHPPKPYDVRSIPPYTPPSSPTGAKRNNPPPYCSDTDAPHKLKFESKTITIGVVFVCTTILVALWSLSPMIQSGANMMDSSSNVVDAGADAAKTATHIVWEISDTVFGIVRGGGRAWCQHVKVGCLPESKEPVQGTPGYLQELAGGHLIEGRDVAHSLIDLKHLEENPRAAGDALILAQYLEHEPTMDEATRWSVFLASSSPLYQDVLSQKDAAFVHTRVVLQGLVDQHEAIQEISDRRFFWPFGKTDRQASIKAEVITMIKHTIVNQKIADMHISNLKQTSRKLAFTELDILSGAHLQLRKYLKLRNKGIIARTVCYIKECNNADLESKIELLQTVVNALEQRAAESAELIRISDRLTNGLNTFVGAVNMTLGVSSSPETEEIELRKEPSLPRLRRAVLGIQTSLRNLEAAWFAK